MGEKETEKKPKDPKKPCPECGGGGTVFDGIVPGFSYSGEGDGGPFGGGICHSVSKRCPECRGSGRVWR